MNNTAGNGQLKSGTFFRFTFPGIGKLVVQQHKARIGQNPQTGEAINILAKNLQVSCG